MAVRSEAASRSGRTAAAAAFDVAAFFESVDWTLLEQRARAADFPEGIFCMAKLLYGAARHVGTAGAATDALFPRRGIAPGCQWAMTFAKRYLA